MVRIVFTASMSEYKVLIETGRVVVEKTHQPKFKKGGEVKIGEKFYGDAVDLQEGKPMVLKSRGNVVLTTSVVKGVFGEKGKGAK